MKLETELIGNEIGYSFLRPRRVSVADVIGFVLIIGIVTAVLLAVIG